MADAAGASAPSTPTQDGLPAGGRGQPDHPFRRDGLLTRILPFAGVAVLAEASLALPPGPVSAADAVASVILFAAAAGAVFLPWDRLPAWASLIVPLLYAASIFPLAQAAGGSGSGIAIVLLVPLIWTALFHRPWESACVSVVLLVVLAAISLVPDMTTGTVLARRLVFWAALSAMITIATHLLRARISRSREESARLQGRLRELSIMADRDRIASKLHDTVVQRLFAAGLSLQGISLLAGAPEVSRRIDGVVHNLDESIRLLRQAIFGLEQGLPDQGLRRSILDVSNELTPALGVVPEVTLDGPIDTAVSPRIGEALLAVLREALGRSGASAQASEVAVSVTADGGEVALTLTDDGVRWTARWAGHDPGFGRLSDRADRLGGTLRTAAESDGTMRLAWRVPLRSAATAEDLPAPARPASLRPAAAEPSPASQRASG